MSTIESVLSRMMDEPAFVEIVSADAEKALKGYDLSTEELEKFKTISRTDLASFNSASPEERKSFIFIGSANGGVWKTTDGFKP